MLHHQEQRTDMNMSMCSHPLLGTPLLFPLALPPTNQTNSTATMVAWIIQAIAIILDKHHIQHEILIATTTMTPTLLHTATLNQITEGTT